MYTHLNTLLLIFHCIKVKFRCSESETLFVFTVITRSQNIGRPLLKRFPWYAIVCLYTAPTFTVSVRQTYWEYFLYEFSSIFIYTMYVYVVYITCINIYVSTYIYVKFHPYPLWHDDFFRGLQLSRLYYLFCG